MSLTNARVAAFASLFCASLLAGCGTGSSPVQGVQPGAALQGRLMGGQQAVAGARISLYAAGAGGTGLGASSLLTVPVVSLLNGGFSITNDYTCPSPTSQVYLVARGGNPGLAAPTDNAALVMMTALGDCQNLPGTAFITVNEVTTAAAAWSLSQFLVPGGGVGSSVSNATGMRNAFLAPANLVNIATGYAPGSTLPAGATMETSKLYTLADALAVCVNSDGGNACSPLFGAATFGGVVPANTLDAALAIVRHPATHVATVFNASPANGPFQPVLASAPNDWTLTLSYVGGGISYPTAVGVDSFGDVWTANYFGGSVSKLLPNGAPATASGYPDSALHESYGLTIDPQDNVWVANEENDSDNYYNGSISKFNNTGSVLSGTGFIAGGIYYPYAVAADSNSTIWVADYGRSGATLLANDGTSLVGASGYSSVMLPLPVAVALDGSHNGWFAAQGSAVKVTPSGVISQYSCCRTTSGIAVDATGNVWITDYSATALNELNSNGALLQHLTGVGGISYPESVAIDGASSVWVTSYRGNTISGFGAAAGGAASAVLSPSTGFGTDAGLQEPFGLAIDASGNVWVSNFAGASLTQFLGLAAPIKTPFAGPPVAP